MCYLVKNQIQPREHDISTVNRNLGMKAVQDFIKVKAYTIALRNTGIYGFQGPEVEAMVNEQLVLGRHYQEVLSSIRRELYYLNIVHLYDSWFAFQVIKANGKKTMVLKPLTSKGVENIKKDIKLCEELTGEEYSLIIQDDNNFDLEEISRIKAKQVSFSETLLEKHLGIKCRIIEGGQEGLKNNLVITWHALERWCQRSNIIEMEIQKLRTNPDSRNAVIEQVREAFLDARKMHRKDNVNYYFDPKKQIHYIVIDNVLVTLYKNDFGFNSKINSYITQNQYLYIKKLAKETNQSQSKLNRVLERLHKKKAYQEDRIKKMEDLLNQEKQKKLSIETEIQTNFDLKNSLNDKLSAAEKKLFKPWKVTLKEDLMQDEDKIICPDEKELDKEPVPSLVADLN